MIGVVSRYGAYGASTVTKDGFYQDDSGRGGYWYKYQGGTITIVREPGSSRLVAKQVVPQSDAYNSILSHIITGQAVYRGTSVEGASGPIVAARSGTVDTGVEGQVTLSRDADKVETGDGTPAWIQSVNALLPTLAEVGVSLGTGLSDLAGGSALAKLQKQLAQKQAALAKATNPGVRAKLATEIASLQARIASYQQSIGGGETGQEGYIADTSAIVSKSAVPWSTIAFVGAGAIGVGALLWSLSRDGK